MDRGEAAVWDLDSGQRSALSFPHKATVYVSRLSVDGRWLLTASEDQTAQLWEWKTGTPHGLLQHQNAVWGAALSADNQTVFTGTWNQTAQFWTASQGEAVGHVLKHGAPILAVDLSPVRRGRGAALECDYWKNDWPAVAAPATKLGPFGSVQS
jgi:WD40 repeat protein